MAVLNKIAEFIEKRGISRYRFWQDTGLGRDTAYRLCNDAAYVPTGSVLDKICGTYKVQPGELLVWVSDHSNDDSPNPTDLLSTQAAQVERNSEADDDLGNRSHLQKGCINTVAA